MVQGLTTFDQKQIGFRFNGLGLPAKRKVKEIVLENNLRPEQTCLGKRTR